jgi:soluble lytic murein transglycosylase-like protein
MGALLDAIMGQQYRPTDNAYGIGAAGVVDALPMLNNPYASTGKNALYTLGGTLLGGVLANYARRESDANNAAMFKTALGLRGLSPTAMESAVSREPRLANYASALLEQQQLQELENVKLEQQNNFEIEKARQIAGINQQGKMQELAVTNPYAYNNALKKGLISPDGAIQSAPSIISNQVGNQATGQELASTLQELGGAKTSRFEDLMNEYGGNETIVNQILGDERDRGIKQREEIEKYLNDTQPSLDSTELILSNLKNALIEAGDTGGVLGEDTGRAAKLYAQSALGNEGASKRLAARKDLEALGLSAAAEIRKNFPGAVSNKEMELFLGAVPSTGNTFEQNKALYDRIEKGYKIAKQKQEFIQKSASEGLSLSEANKAFNNFNKAIPPFKNGEINPLRENLDFNSVDTKEFLSGVPQLKPQIAEQVKTEQSAQQIPNIEDARALVENVRQQQSGDPLQKGNVLAQAVDSALLGKSKYILAPLDTAYEEAKDLIGLGEGRSVRENLSASVDRLGQGLEAGEKLYPQSSTGAQLLGAVVSPVNKLYGGVKAVTTLGKIANVGKKAAITAGIAGVQAAGESDISSAAKTGALISGGLDAMGGIVGKAAKISPSVLNKAYGIFKSDYNSVAKQFSARNIDKIKTSVDDGLNIIKKEAGITTKEAFKNNEDFYTDMFKKSEELIAKRTNLVDDIVRDVGAVTKPVKLSTSDVFRSIGQVQPEEKISIVKKINELVKANNLANPKGFTLQGINELKRLYNPSFKYNPQTVDEKAMSGFVTYLRNKVENSIDTLAKAKTKKIDSNYTGVIKQVNGEIKDLINVQNIYGKKIPGARADDLLSTVRQSLYTTGGAGTQGARNVGEALAGELGGKIGVGMAGLTAANRVLRPATQSFIKNQEAIRSGLESQGLRTAMTSGGSDAQKDYSEMFSSDNQSSNVPYDQMFNTRSSQQASQASIAQPQQSISRQQSQSSSNSAPVSAASQNISYNPKEIKQFASKLPPLIQAVIATESNFNPKAVSSAGAKGLMQVMPFHYERLGVTNPFDPVQSIKAGATILQEELDRFQNLPLALAAYNAGAPAVQSAIKKANSNQFSQIEKFLPAETRSYVKKVLNNMSKVRSA